MKFLSSTTIPLLIPEPRLEKSPFGNGFGPQGPAGGGPQPPPAGPAGPLNPFMALNHPAAQAAFFSQTAAAGLSPAHLAAAAAAGLPGAAAAPRVDNGNVVGPGRAKAQALLDEGHTSPAPKCPPTG